MSWCLVKHPSFCWDEIMAWGERHAKSKSLRFNVFRLALWSAVYHIWQQRNGVLHQGRIYVEKKNILHLIKWEVRRRIEGNGYFANSVQNKVLFCLWGFSLDVLKSSSS